MVELRVIRTVGGGALIVLTGQGGRERYLLAVGSIAAVVPNVVRYGVGSGSDEVDGTIVLLHGSYGRDDGWHVDQSVAEVEALILEAASA